MNINPNDTVRVKLTETGKALIVASIDRLNDDVRRNPKCHFRASVPKWDNNGWITAQFHTIMGYFGDCWTLGVNLPFSEMEKP